MEEKANLYSYGAGKGAEVQASRGPNSQAEKKARPISSKHIRGSDRE